MSSSKFAIIKSPNGTKRNSILFMDFPLYNAGVSGEKRTPADLPQRALLDYGQSSVHDAKRTTLDNPKPRRKISRTLCLREIDTALLDEQYFYANLGVIVDFQNSLDSVAVEINVWNTATTHRIHHLALWRPRLTSGPIQVSLKTWTYPLSTSISFLRNTGYFVQSHPISREENRP